MHVTDCCPWLLLVCIRTYPVVFTNLLYIKQPFTHLGLTYIGFFSVSYDTVQILFLFLISWWSVKLRVYSLSLLNVLQGRVDIWNFTFVFMSIIHRFCVDIRWYIHIHKCLSSAELDMGRVHPLVGSGPDFFSTGWVGSGPLQCTRPVHWICTKHSWLLLSTGVESACRKAKDKTFVSD